MVVVMDERATEAQIEQVVARLMELGMDAHRSTGVTRTVIGAVGQQKADPRLIEILEGVREVLRTIAPAIGRSICLDLAARRGWGT